MKRLTVLCVAALLLSAALDALRPPERQIGSRIFVAAVHLYQRDISPFTSHFFQCRYNPTCSHYGVEAVERFGIAHGLYLTAKRIGSCRGSVPLGTYDPVPAR